MSHSTLGRACAFVSFGQRRGLPMRVAGLLLGAVLLAPVCCVAQDGAAQVDAHLAAGEFAPALERARQENDPAMRDRLLGKVAAAQARASGPQASLRTVADIQDDRQRAALLQSIAQRPLGAGRGGGADIDFDTLIELMTSTIHPETWDIVGGPGAVDGFPGGVHFDPSGLLKKTTVDRGTVELAELHRKAFHRGGNGDVRKSTALRKVSLNRLEKHIQMQWAVGNDPNEAMRNLAGVYKLKYIFFYPETGDIVLAGPAGDWTTDSEGRAVNTETERPVLQLDDLVVLLRNAQIECGRFGCSITPTKDNLAATRAFLQESAKRPLRAGERPRWLKQIRDTMGKQTIEVYGIDPRTRTGKIIVEADYRMKLVGMGLEDGVLGVKSYLARIPSGAAPPPLDVLRWWFTLNHEAILTTGQGNAFELKGQGVKVLSENELLTERGERVHTGKSDELNREFARDFTEHFAELAIKYPIYAELENVFDLALAAAVIFAEDMPTQANWRLTHFGDPKQFEVRLGVAATEVETVINHRVIDRVHVVAGVSGGVTVRTQKFVKPGAIKTVAPGPLHAARDDSPLPQDLPWDAWWWD
jgi:hypothetical protein